MNAEDVLKRITNLCQSHQLSLYALAKQSGVPLSTLSGLYHRKNYPSIPTLEKLCHTLDLTLGDFFSDISCDLVFPDTSASDITVTSNELLLLRKYRRLSLLERQYLNAYLDALLTDKL